MKYLVIVCALLFAPAALADDLQLSGVSGRTAIVNDQVVAVGDTIGNYRVVEIGADYAVFDNGKGKVTRRLKELETKEAAKPAAVLKPTVKPGANKVPAAVPQPLGQVPEKAGKHLDKSLDYLREADELLKSQLKFNDLYERANNLCADAGREAQSALNMITDADHRKPVQQHISKIQKVQQAITRERDELNTRVRTAIINRQVFQGMTTQNVLSSWGTPLSKTTVGPIERWTYKDPNGYQRNLNFSKGVLVSF